MNSKPYLVNSRWAIFATLLGLLVFPGRPALAQAPKDLTWTHAYDLATRKSGEAEFSKETKRWGMEAFKDGNTNLGILVAETGCVVLAPNFEKLSGVVADAKGPQWLTGLDLPARKAGEREFTKATKVNSLEVFRDPAVDNWIYITERGWLAVATASSKPSGGDLAPKWVHSVDLAVRKGGEKDWKNAAKLGIEVYRDVNTKNLVFICETGHIAVAPEAAEVKGGGGKAPEWLHGLDLACRRFDERTFSRGTKKYGVEIFREEVTQHLIFLCETGSIAVAPAPAGLKTPTVRVKEPVWTHGLNMKCRAYGEKEFSEKTKIYGAEVFRDDNLGMLISVSETGMISVAPAAKNMK